jgi:hypothetical protein
MNVQKPSPAVKRRLVLYVIPLIICCACNGSLFATVLPPGYGEPGSNSTGQRWIPPVFGPAPLPGEPWPDPEPLLPGSYPPVEVDNPFGVPSVDLGDGWESEWVNPPGTNPEDPVGPIPTWHYNEDLTGGGNGTLKITIPNSPELNTLKYVWFSIIADKSPSDAARPIGVTAGYDHPVNSGDMSVSWVASAWVSEQLGGSTPDGGVWYRYEGMAEIRPNPQTETLEFDILHCTNIADIEVRTVCIPEPATLSLLALGGMALLRRRIRN